MALEQAPDFKKVGDIAIRAILRMPDPVTELCGPLSTGGRGSFEENKRVFRHVAEILTKKGHHVFDLDPLDLAIPRLMRAWQADHGHDQYCMPILEEIFLPVFDTCKIRRAYFIPGWKSSFGARWEHDYFTLSSVEITYLAEAVLADFEPLEIPQRIA